MKIYLWTVDLKPMSNKNVDFPSNSNSDLITNIIDIKDTGKRAQIVLDGTNLHLCCFDEYYNFLNFDLSQLFAFFAVADINPEQLILFSPVRSNPVTRNNGFLDFYSNLVGISNEIDLIVV